MIAAFRRLDDEVTHPPCSSCALNLRENQCGLLRARPAHQRSAGDIAQRTESPETLDHDLAAAGDFVSALCDGLTNFER